MSSDQRIRWVTGAILAMTATSAFAQNMPEIADADGNGLWSLTELQGEFPDLTEEAFVSLDANGDGGIDGAELASAIADGAIKLPAE